MKRKKNCIHIFCYCVNQITYSRMYFDICKQQPNLCHKEVCSYGSSPEMIDLYILITLQKG